MATINHKTYNEGTETFKDFSVYDGKDTLIFKVDGSAQSAAVTGTLAVSGNATFDTNTLFVDAANNRVGVGTVTPTQALTVNGNAAVGGQQAFWLRDDDGFSANAARRAWAITANYNTLGTLSIYGGSAANSDPLAGTAFLNINSAGNVGIGTSAPTATLDARIAGTTSGAVIKVGNVGTGDFGGLAVSDGGTYPVQLYGSSLAFLTGNSAYASTTEKVRINSAGALLVGTTTAPTVNTGTVAVIGSSAIHSGILNFPSPYSGNVQIDIVYSSWGSNNVIGLVDVMVGLREFGATSGAAFGKVFATNSGASAGFDTFNTTDVTTSQCTITAASGGNFTLRITIDPSNNTDLGSFYLNIPTGGGVTVSSISVTIV